MLGRALNWDVSRINTEITSLALILVMVTVYGFVAITRGGILCCGISRITTQLIKVTRLVQIFVLSLDICDQLFLFNKQRQSSDQTLHNPLLQFMAE